ncbi:MAG: GNAT family N-acetyltransferase [Ilumatobacteraceae bacterium]
MHELLLRPATTADVPEFGRIDVATEAMFVDAGHPEFADGGTIPDDVAARAIAEDRITVAELDGVVVGWVYVTRVEGELCIGQISVDPAAQRTGVGTAMLRRVIEAARAADEPSILLNTQSDVPWNQPWYEKFGFEVVPEQRWTSGLRAIVSEQTGAGLDWTTRVHMRLVLASR